MFVNRLLLYSSIALALLAVMLIISGSVKPVDESIEFCHDTTVDVTVYRAVKKETNKNVNITASGFVIRGKVSLVAVSRDLLKYYPYGTIIAIDHPEINKRYGYLFVVLDTTHKRLRNTVDILIDKNESLGKWTGVKIKKIHTGRKDI
jgi:3D (Asp-Asp-Asp) domain-containing protein